MGEGEWGGRRLSAEDHEKHSSSFLLTQGVFVGHRGSQMSGEGQTIRKKPDQTVEGTVALFTFKHSFE